MKNKAYETAKQYASNGLIDFSRFVVEDTCTTRQEDFCSYIEFHIEVPHGFCHVEDIEESFNFNFNATSPGAPFSHGYVYIIADEDNFYGNVYIRNGLDV